MFLPGTNNNFKYPTGNGGITEDPALSILNPQTKILLYGFLQITGHTANRILQMEDQLGTMWSRLVTLQGNPATLPVWHQFSAAGVGLRLTGGAFGAGGGGIPGSGGGLRVRITAASPIITGLLAFRRVG